MLFVLMLTLTIVPTASVAGDADALNVKLGVAGGLGAGTGGTAAPIRSNGAVTVAVNGVPAAVIFVALAVSRCRPSAAFEGTTTEASNEPRPFA